MPTISPAVRIIQREGAPVMYAASIPAGELLKWCAVPKATADSGGYQRALNEGRQSAIAAYLEQDEMNLLPGAVIVAVDENHLEVEEIQGTDGAFKLTITDDNREIKTKLAEYLAELKARLEEDPSSASAPGAGDDDVESPSDRPSSHLASIAEKLENAHQNWERIEADDPDKKEITEYVEDATKRGLIIDGQHRVYGAKVPEVLGVELPVILVPGLEHAEQAFQFYVLNNTAKPLNQTQLRRIVATSLTNPEIENLYHRFHQSGLKTEDALWTYKMNTSEDSPFFGRIDFAYEEQNSSEVIRENVAFQLVRSFVRLKTSDYESLLGPIAKKWEDDDNEYRLKLFFQLWNGISERYDELWKPATESAEDDTKQPQIFKKVSLLALQKLVLDRLENFQGMQESPSKSPFEDPAKLEEAVFRALLWLPPEFFTKPWAMTSLDTQDGRKFVLEQMIAVIHGKGKNIGQRKLFKRPKASAA